MSTIAQALLIANPDAGQGLPQAESVAEVLRAQFEVVTYFSESAQAAQQASKEAAAESYQAVFALGGDGTVRQVATGLLGSKTELWVLPGGTTNVVSKALDLDQKPTRAAQQLLEGTVIEADTGLAGQEIFLMQASGGLDVEVLESVNPIAKRHLGRAAYAAPAVQRWWQYDYPEIEIETEGVRRKVAFFAACNLPYYAGRFRLAPHADFTTRQLELITLSKTGKWAALEFAVALARTQHTDLQGVAAKNLQRLVVHGPADLHIQLDGDPIQIQLPLEIKVAPASLRLRVP